MEDQFSPIIRIPNHLNPFVGGAVKVNIFAAPLYSAAMLNSKGIMVKSMLASMALEGALAGVHTLVEATSGNTGLALGIEAPYSGIRRVVAIVKRDTAPGKLEQLRLAGVDYEFSDSPIALAQEMGKRDGWLNLNQYNNPRNWMAHESFTAPYVWRQTHGKLTVFCGSLGTTGTVVGFSRFFEKIGAKQVGIVGVTCAPGHAVPGVRTLDGLAETGFGWESAICSRQDVDTRSAYLHSLNLCRAGIFAGPSSGLAFAGLLDFLQAVDLDSFRNEDGEVVAVFACGDTAIPYLEKYSMILNSDDFKPLQLASHS